MSRRRVNVNYTRLPQNETEHAEKEEVDGDFRDEQFYRPPRQFPWKTVIFVLGFMFVGAVCLAFGILISTGYFDEKYDDRSWPLLILGILMFIPGGYYGYILICICLRRDGFTWDDIPML